MAGPTRFKDRNYDGPVSGALITIPVYLHATIATNRASTVRLKFPAGMSFRVTDITFTANTVTSDPSIVVGNSTNATALVAAANLTTNQSLTIKNPGRIIAAGGRLVATITNDTGDSFTDGMLFITGHVAAPPDSVAERHSGHY